MLRIIRSTNELRLGIAATLSCLLFGVSIAPAVYAAPQVWGAKGIISGFAGDGPFPADLQVGTTVVIQLSFDDATPDSLLGDTTRGLYPGAVDVTLAFVGISALHQASATGYDMITRDNAAANAVSKFDSFLVFPNAATDLVFPSLGILNARLVLELDETELNANPPPTVVMTDAIPAAPPVITDFSVRILALENSSSELFLIEMGLVEFALGGSNLTPLIPDSATVNPDGTITWHFGTIGVTSCLTGCWIDPPASSAFRYAMTNGARFTEIVDFPTGFSGDFEVSVGGTSLGSFGPGQSVDFTGYAGGGVSEFTVSGIAPLAELNDTEAFPLQLAFDSPAATFTMTSGLGLVPALGLPGKALIVGLLILVPAVVRRMR